MKMRSDDCLHTPHARKGNKGSDDEEEEILNTPPIKNTHFKECEYKISPRAE
jgi:hypothetical protein